MSSSAGPGGCVASLDKGCGARFRIQYASDLHLEFGNGTAFESILKPVAPYLALAGDVGRPDQQSYSDFLKYCSQNWQQTFVIAGNHELYNDGGNSEGRKVDSAADRLLHCASISTHFPNVHFLNRGRYELDCDGLKLSVLGATLWTNLDTEEKQAVAEKGINDFRYIAVDQEPQEDCGPHRLLTAADVLNWHRSDREWLRREIALNAEINRPVIVISHHLPTYKLIDRKYLTSPVNVAFASECSELLTCPVRAWIAGHTHTASQAVVDRIQLGVNPRGYPGEAGTGYSHERCFDVDVSP